MHIHRISGSLRAPIAVLFAIALAAPSCEDVDTEGDDDSADDDDDDGDDGDATSPEGDAGDGVATTPDDGADDDAADDDAADDAADSGVDPATVAACRDECDFFLATDCVDVDEHEACFTACGERSEAEIDLFISCSAAASSCSEDVNPRRECLANFLDIDPPSETGSEGPNCVDACEEYLSTPCDPPIEGVSSCDEFCAMLSEALQQAAAECLDNAVGCELPADCQLPSGG